MTSIYFNQAYVGAGTSFDTTRKSGWIAESLVKRPIEGVNIVSPRSVTAKRLLECHSPQYVHALQTGTPMYLASSAGFGWDEGYWEGITESTGGVVDATLEALRTKKFTGSLSSGLHHASFERGMGFCAINGLALAAKVAKRAGANKVLIVDVDAHCGGGTHSLLKDAAWVEGIDVSVSRLDDFIPDDQRWTLDMVRNGNQYLDTLAFRLDEIDQQKRVYDVAILNLGVDCMEDCSIGGLQGVTAEVIRKREEMLFSWCASRGLPAAFVLAGGYSGSRLPEESLVDLHRYAIQSCADAND